MATIAADERQALQDAVHRLLSDRSTETDVRRTMETEAGYDPTLWKPLAEMGVVIAPPMPAFYNKPKDLDDIVNHTVGRALDLFDIDTGKVKRWD